MDGKLKLAICNLGGCGGCDEAILDLSQSLLDVAEAMDIVFWPLLSDYKYSHLESLGLNEITLSIISGNIHNSEQEHLARQLREKSALVLALGACACFGGTPGLAGLTINRTIYSEKQPTDMLRGAYGEKFEPFKYDRVFPLNQIINIDYYLPGCPPPARLIDDALNAVIKRKLPHKGATLAPHRALCDTCKRNRSKPERLSIKQVKRIHEIEADPDDCFLAQGILCFGPVTRGGCNEACLNINMPCRGCFGPVEGITDGGTKFISSLATLIDAETEEEVAGRIDQMVDLAGYFYRFSLPVLQLQLTARGSKHYEVVCD